MKFTCLNDSCCHNPSDNATQPQPCGGLDMKMTVHTTPPPQKLNDSSQEPLINIY